MIKTEGLLKSQLEIVDDHLNRAVSANYKDFLTGIRLIQEIDLDLSRSDIYIQNTRRMLKDSMETITIISFWTGSRPLNPTPACRSRTSAARSSVCARCRASSRRSRT